MFSGLFFRDGRVIGLSQVFRSLCIPLGISVECPVLEIASLDWGFGLKMGDFASRLCAVKGDGPCEAC
jgi:hypothetical protein